MKPMIINRVPYLVNRKFEQENRRVNLSEIQKDTRLTYSTVYRWMFGNIHRYDAPAIEAWCKYLGVKVGDILVYEEDGS
jgi:DNA-binding Xre family transcriptional regulator